VVLVGPLRNWNGLLTAVIDGDCPEVMLGIFACCSTGAIATVTALSAVPIIATYPSLAILRARLVPTVGSPASSKTSSCTLRPLTPPLAFHWSTASFAPLDSQAPSELSCPLCASTTAILIGPLVSAGVDDELPGALQALPAPIATAAVAHASTRPMPNRVMIATSLCQGSLCQGSGGVTRRRLGRCP
jgi:hypothetical protein